MTSATTLPAAPQNVWWLYLLQGIAGIILGLMLITAPGATLLALVTFLGFYWLFSGVLSLVQVFADRSIPWIWSLISGLLGIVAGCGNRMTRQRPEDGENRRGGHQSQDQPEGHGGALHHGPEPPATAIRSRFCGHFSLAGDSGISRLD